MYNAAENCRYRGQRRRELSLTRTLEKENESSVFDRSTIFKTGYRTDSSARDTRSSDRSTRKAIATTSERMIDSKIYGMWSERRS